MALIDALKGADELTAQQLLNSQLRRPNLAIPPKGPAPVQTMDYSQKGPAMTVPQGSAPTDPDAPKPQAPSIFSNPNSVYAGWGGPAPAAAPRQPLPADRDPFANRAALAQVAQPPQPTNPVVAAPGTAAPIGRSLSSVASSGAPSADYGNEGRGTSPAQPQPGPLSALAKGRNGELPPGITMTRDAQGNISYSGSGTAGGAGGGAGGYVPGGDAGRSTMDILRNASAIQGEINALQPHAGVIAAPKSLSDTIAPSMPAGLSARQQADFLAQQQQNQIALRGQDLNYGATMAGQGVTARGQDLANQAALAGQGVTMRGQDLTAQESGRRSDLEGQRVGLAAEADRREAEKWSVQRPSLVDAAHDARMLRETRIALNQAINSGDPQAVAKARSLYEAAGGKLERPEVQMQANPMGGLAVLDKGAQTLTTIDPNGKPSTVQLGQQGPSFGDFAAQIRAKNPGQTISDQQLQDAYKQQFGR